MVYTVPLPDGLPVITLNNRDHWSARNKTVQTWRMVVNASVRRAQVPKMDRAKVTLHLVPPDNRRRDQHNLIASYKCAVDGIVDAGRLPDDTPKYLDDSEPVVLHPSERRRNWTFVLVIEDLSDTQAGAA